MSISNIPIHELNEENVRYYKSIIYNTDQVLEKSKFANSEVKDGPKFKEITMEAIIGMKYRKGKVQYLVKWETIDEAEWLEADKCDKQLIKKYLDKNEESVIKETTTKSNPVKNKRNKKSFYEFKKNNYIDDHCSSRKDIRTRITKLCKGEWEDQVEGVESMFRHVDTGEWYTSLKWKNGSLSTHPNKEVNIKCPQKKIKINPMSEEAGEISPTAWDKLMEEVSWLREAYTHKCSEVGYLSGETDRMKWLYDQSCEQIVSLKAQNEHLKKELDESEYLRKKLTEQVGESKIDQYKKGTYDLLLTINKIVKSKRARGENKRHHNRGGRFQNYRNLSLNLKKNNNNGNGDSNDNNDKRNKDTKNSQWDSTDEREKSSEDEVVIDK
ncbi:hypothetical protein GLOIN_2v1612401 [Rhizophagus clarus]|uniref:Chromo domain-containing protein n=1 Tax=Rhizophagus clarus TaxID=94130 RepID=A0A8H3R2Z4_9GLOM|nr:hypothetical protein GLOIN_2v1612401 [Rhizophagus clarus]